MANQTTTPCLRRCIKCKLPITFSWLELPIVASARNSRVIAYVYVHPSDAACQHELEYRQPGRTDLAANLARANDAAARQLDKA